MNWVRRGIGSAAAVALGAVLAGCGMPGAPMPPSLNLAVPVNDLSAARAGDQVSLTWTMPKKNTDKLLLKGLLRVEVCRREGSTGPCTPAGNVQFAPEAAGTFSETLPAALGNGAPHKLAYFVEIKNANGHSAGPSNGAVVLAGEAPGAVSGLSAEVRKGGVVLRWASSPQGTVPTAVRLNRKLLTPPAAKNKDPQGPLAPAAEPVEMTLLVDPGEHSAQAPDQALDNSIHFGNVYEYRAQRVARVQADGQTLELVGELSAPVRVDAQDVFPPAVPIGLAAVAVAGENESEPAIDLSWQPNSEADLAGYAVYRREGDGGWQRISLAQPVVGPAFHDAHVQAGHSYSYAVSAIDAGGHESARSVEATETVPTP
jgi:hypothetical protein